MQPSDRPASAASVPEAATRRRQVYVVHGYTAAPNHHWFPWLKAQLEADGVAVDVLSMPDASRPVAAAWDAWLETQVLRRDEDSWFVAHSLGCISLLRYVLRTPAQPCGGMLLVAGFAEALPDYPELDDFVAGVGSLASVRASAGHRTVIASADDEVVPHAMTRRLAGQLGADFLTVERGGHFLGREGFTVFPLVYEQLTKMMRAPVKKAPPGEPAAPSGQEAEPFL